MGRGAGELINEWQVAWLASCLAPLSPATPCLPWLLDGLAGGAGGAAVSLGLCHRPPLDVALWHEADEDAVRLVVPGHAAQHGHQVIAWHRVLGSRERRLAAGGHGLRLGGFG